ncbi:hypothetical protein BpHYR1_018212 [Brachionus plicatilis]|uniref:Secreted protein n=1 Tax=Brachionus plicatilis TaxID=10195 RepID=A0A3M7S306_BRAPC|nr:hypothetical protein BpHYR1_018212 [Brachionus plicatilis]
MVLTTICVILHTVNSISAKKESVRLHLNRCFLYNDLVLQVKSVNFVAGGHLAVQLGGQNFGLPSRKKEKLVAVGSC